MRIMHLLLLTWTFITSLTINVQSVWVSMTNLNALLFVLLIVAWTTLIIVNQKMNCWLKRTSCTFNGIAFNICKVFILLK